MALLKVIEKAEELVINTDLISLIEAGKHNNIVITFHPTSNVKAVSLDTSIDTFLAMLKKDGV